MLGSVSILTRALWQAFDSASSMGKVPACMSKKSVGVMHRVPVIASVAVRWSFWRAYRVPTEPEFFVAPTGLCGGMYHVSMPYMILGRATARYSCLISLEPTPVCGLVSLRY